MENKVNISASENSYLKYFQIAQYNLELVEEERLRRRIRRSKKQLLNRGYKD